MIDEPMTSLHRACYDGDLARVRALLETGADPNLEASPGEWVSCATAPHPLNCVATAWAMSEAHVEIARLLIARGAKVDETVVRDLEVEMASNRHDAALLSLLRSHQS
jgi:hypothetical protein